MTIAEINNSIINGTFDKENIEIVEELKNTKTKEIIKSLAGFNRKQCESILNKAMENISEIAMNMPLNNL